MTGVVNPNRKSPLFYRRDDGRVVAVHTSGATMDEKSLEDRVTAIEALFGGKTIETHFREHAELFDWMLAYRFEEFDKKWDQKLAAGLSGLDEKFDVKLNIKLDELEEQ